jgi:hypothetical protein
MSMGVYSEDEDQFLPKMEGADHPNVGLPLPESWDLRTSRSGVFLHPGRGLPCVHLVCIYASGSCVPMIQKTWGYHICIRKVGLIVPEARSG